MSFNNLFNKKIRVKEGEKYEEISYDIDIEGIKAENEKIAAFQKEKRDDKGKRLEKSEIEKLLDKAVTNTINGSKSETFKTLGLRGKSAIVTAVALMSQFSSEVAEMDIEYTDEYEKIQIENAVIFSKSVFEALKLQRFSELNRTFENVYEIAVHRVIQYVDEVLSYSEEHFPEIIGKCENKLDSKEFEKKFVDFVKTTLNSPFMVELLENLEELSLKHLKSSYDFAKDHINSLYKYFMFKNIKEEEIVNMLELSEYVDVMYIKSIFRSKIFELMTDILEKVFQFSSYWNTLRISVKGFFKKTVNDITEEYKKEKAAQDMNKKFKSQLSGGFSKEYEAKVDKTEEIAYTIKPGVDDINGDDAE